MIKAAIFDLGNVLVFFDHLQMIEQVSKVCGIAPEKAQEELIAKQIGIQYELGLIETEEVYNHLRKMSTTSPNNEQLYLAIGDIFKINEPMLEIIDSLKRRKMRLIILSNTCEAHIDMIRRKFSILDEFDAHVYSYEIKARKPDPLIFQKAVELAGCSPKECFYTDDILEYVDAGRNLGLDAEQFTTPDQLIGHLRSRNLV